MLNALLANAFGVETRPQFLPLLCNCFNIYRSYQEFFAGYYRNFADLCVEHHLLRLRNRLVFEAIGIVFFNLCFYRFCCGIVPKTAHLPVHFVQSRLYRSFIKNALCRFDDVLDDAGFEIRAPGVVSVYLFHRLRFKRESTMLAALHWGWRTEPSARSPSVLEHYATLTSMPFDLATAVVGRCTFSTPSRNSAVTFVLSVSSGSVKLRRKLPKDRSIRWNFLF